MKTLTTIITLCITAITSHAAIITVKTDGTGNFTSIQQAYLAAASGDTILVYSGTYYENLDLNIPGKNITIASLYLTTQDASFILNTIINGSQSGSCIAVRETGQALVVFIGFTITNGSGFPPTSTGGGVYLNNSNCIISYCLIQENRSYSGGGIYARSSELSLKGSTIRCNHAYLAGGGIQLSLNSTITFDAINRNNIYLNHASRSTDFHKTHPTPPVNFIVDTFTIQNPDIHFIGSIDNIGNTVSDIILDISNAKIEPVMGDLYVDPINGADSYTGLTPSDALKTISFAYKKVIPDTLNINNIYLANGIYSHTANSEKFPLNLRSYVNLIGQNRDSTILDAESMIYHVRGNNLTRKYSLSNLSLINGSGLNQLPYKYRSGISLTFNNDVVLSNLLINNCLGVYGHLSIVHSDSIFLNAIQISYNQGGAAGIGYSWSGMPPGTFRIENMIIDNNNPDYSMGFGSGGGLSISGRLSLPHSYSGRILNLQITNNVHEPDPEWGPRMAVALSLMNNVNVDIVNASIGHNTLIGNEGYAAKLIEGASLSLYNSVFYYDSLYEIALGDHNLPVTANIAYSNIEGGKDQIYNWNNAHTLNWLEGNIDMDPLWVGSGDFPYQLQWNSPCINAGTPMFEDGMQPPYIKLEAGKIVLYKIDGDTLHLPSHDLAGKPRIRGGRIDMGAYEFQDTVNLVRNNPWQQQDNKLHIYPNPFSAHTFISFKTKTPGDIVAVVSDMNGRHIKTLMDARTSGGEYSITWKGDDNNGNAVPKGTYIINVSLNGQVKTTGKIVKN
jgi:hypothetical protein